MRFELKKICINHVVVIAILLLAIFNGCSYYKNCDHMKNLKSEYEQGRTNEELQQRADAVLNYENSIQEINRNALVLMKTGAFEDETSYSYRTLLKSLEVYKGMQDVKPVQGYYGGVELISEWKMCDAIIFILAIMVTLMLFTQERRMGYVSLIYPTKKGKLPSYINKFCAMEFLIVLASIFLYGTVLIITQKTLGMGNMYVPLQSVYGFELCPFHISIKKFIIIFITLKLFMYLMVGAVVVMLCTVADSILSSILLNLLFVGVGFGMSLIENLWMRNLSPIYDLKIVDIFNGYICLNLFGYPIWQVVPRIIFAIFLIVFCFVAGAISFCKKTAVGNSQNWPLKNKINYGKTPSSLFGFEIYKLLFLRTGFACLIIMACVQFYSYHGFAEQDDIIYKHYASILEGTKSAEKDEFLREEQGRFDKINEQIEHYETIYQDQQDILLDFTMPLYKQLEAQNGFEEASDQYNSMEDTAVFINENAYKRLYGCHGICDDILNSIKLVIVFIIVFSGVMAVEYETGVMTLYNTAGKAKFVKKRKILACFLFAVPAFVIAYLPQYIVISQTYGLSMLGAGVMNTEIFSGFPVDIPLWGMLILTQLIRGLIMAAIAVTIIWISDKIRDTVYTIIVSSVLTLMPWVVLFIM